MPDLYGPFDAATMGQAGWYRDRGYLEPSGVVGPPATSPASGALPLTANGLTVSLGLGRAHVRGAYYERTGTVWSYNLPANTHATAPRIDRVVLRRNPSAPAVLPVLIAGTPGAGVPALTRVEDGLWDLPLHQVAVPPASGTVVTITDDRPWIAPDGGGLIRLAATPAAFTDVWDELSYYDPGANRYVQRRNGLWRLGSAEWLHAPANVANSLSNPGYASTTYLWVAGMGAKVTVPADGITRQIGITARVQCAGDGYVRLRRDLGSGGITYWPNATGVRSSASTEDALSVLGGETLAGTDTATYYMEARSTVSAGASFYAPQMTVLAA